MNTTPFLTITVSRKTSPWGIYHLVDKALRADARQVHPSGNPPIIVAMALDPCGVRSSDPWGPQPTPERMAKEIREQADVEIRFVESITTEDLIIDAVRYGSDMARWELTQRGVDWAKYINCA